MPRLTDLTEQQKNELVHEKVLGKSLSGTCSNSTLTKGIQCGYTILPNGRQAFIYQWYCTECDFCGRWQEQTFTGEYVHDAQLISLPNYCTDLNKTWEIIRHFKDTEYFWHILGADYYGCGAWDTTVFLSVEEIQNLTPLKIVNAALVACRLAKEE